MVLIDEVIRYRRELLLKCSMIREPVTGRKIPLMEQAFQLKRCTPRERDKFLTPDKEDDRPGSRPSSRGRPGTSSSRQGSRPGTSNVKPETLNAAAAVDQGTGADSVKHIRDLDRDEDVGVYHRRLGGGGAAVSGGRFSPSDIVAALTWQAHGAAEQGVGGIVRQGMGTPANFQPPRVIVCAGPTSSGKSNLMRRVVLEIIQQDPGERMQLVPIMLRGVDIARAIAVRRVAVEKVRHEERIKEIERRREAKTKGKGKGKKGRGQQRTTSEKKSKAAMIASTTLLDLVLDAKYGDQSTYKNKNLLMLLRQAVRNI
jgi:hypothetical protein